MMEKAQESLAPREHSSPTYEISQEEAHNLCGDFIARRELRPNTKFGCYIISGDDSFSQLGRFVEGKVFNETFQNNPEVMRQEYGPYEAASTFYVVIDHDVALPVGALRIIRNSEAGIKSLEDLSATTAGITSEEFYEGSRVGPEECIDIGTLAVDKNYRGRSHDFIPSLLLYRTLYVKTLQDPQYKQAVSIMDEKIYGQLLNLGMPFKPIINSRPFSYLDSERSYAVSANTQDFLPSVSQKASEYRKTLSLSKHYMSKMMQKLIDGNGLDQMMGYAR